MTYIMRNCPSSLSRDCLFLIMLFFLLKSVLSDFKIGTLTFGFGFSWYGISFSNILLAVF